MVESNLMTRMKKVVLQEDDVVPWITMSMCMGTIWNIDASLEVRGLSLALLELVVMAALLDEVILDLMRSCRITLVDVAP
jgi:hypothetical protein